MKYLFKRDTFLATIAVFGVIAILLHNPLNEHVFNPLKISLTDFALSDMAFSASHLKSTVDDRIVIVNVDTAGRGTLAAILTSLRAYHPKVIGLDLLLPPQASPGNDTLQRAIEKDPAIVLCQGIAHGKDGYILSDNQFLPAQDFAGHSGQAKTGAAAKTNTAEKTGAAVNTVAAEKTGTLLKTGKVPANPAGYVNFVGEEGNVVRFFPPFLKDDRASYGSFTAVIARLYDSAAYRRLQNRCNETEWINYQRPDSGYYTIRFSDFLQDRVDSSFIRGKILLVGYLGQTPYDVRDKHFTPLNGKVLGRSLPDMNGIVIHANILTMILDGNYIARASKGVAITIAVILTWLHMAFLLRYYIHRHLWFHLAVKIAEFLISILVFYLSILLLRYLNWSIDFTWTLIAIILAVDVFYFYEAFTNWLARKWAYKSVFSELHGHEADNKSRQ
ncbi:MAG: CHASE2 domain-containing protein [Puia sp.]|nr:CHASE2 domain-containing protein [Puia sp.]